MKASIIARDGRIIFTLIDEAAETKTSIRMTPDQVNKLVGRLERCRTVARFQNKVAERKRARRKR